MMFMPSTRVAPRDNKTLVPCIYTRDGSFLFFIRKVMFKLIIDLAPS